MEKDVIMQVRVCEDGQLKVTFEGTKKDVSQVMLLLTSMYTYIYVKQSDCPLKAMAEVIADLSEAVGEGIADAKQKIMGEGEE